MLCPDRGEGERSCRDFDRLAAEEDRGSTLGHVEAFLFAFVEMDGDRESLRPLDLDERVRAVGG